MPTYNYRCEKCSLIYIETRKMSAPTQLTECSECSGKLIRVYEFGAVAFKGDGFYTNDKKAKLDLNI